MPANLSNGNGHRCRICGLELDGARPVSEHLSREHGLDLAAYRKCYPGRAFEVLLDEWDETDTDAEGHPIITHVLVRRFVDRTRKARNMASAGCCSASVPRPGSVTVPRPGSAQAPRPGSAQAPRPGSVSAIWTDPIPPRHHSVRAATFPSFNGRARGHSQDRRGEGEGG